MTTAEALARYERELATRDFTRVAPLIAPEAVFWFSDGSHRGIDAIRHAFEETWSVLQNETYWLDDKQWLIDSPEAATCCYRFNWRAEVDGVWCEGAGRGTTVLHRKAGAPWLIVHEHLSPDP